MPRDPHIKVSGFKIWIHSYQYPNVSEYWDANWLNVTAQCEANSAKVSASGSIIHTSEIERWLEQLILLNSSLEGFAGLECMEPELNVNIHAQKTGTMEMVVNITPDTLSQEHRFTFEIDQSFLPELILNCKNSLKEFPVRFK